MKKEVQNRWLKYLAGFALLFVYLSQNNGVPRLSAPMRATAAS